jgi:hypothetical protein
MSTIREDVEADTRPFDAADALLKRWEDAEKPSEHEDEGADSHDTSETEDDEEDTEDQSTDEGEEDSEDQDDESADSDEDEGEEDDDNSIIDNLDAKVKVKIDGEERTVSVRDLTRLFGQEAALTRKSQEVSELRKKAEDEGTRYSTAAQAMLQRALEKYKPYSQIDWVVAQSKLQPDELVALRNEARTAAEDVMFLQNQTTQLVEQAQQERQGQLMDAAKQCMEVLSNPETGIPGWSNQVYDDLRAYAVKAGMDQSQVDMMVDPVAFKIIDKARRFDQAQATAKDKTTKKAKAPKKVLKSKTKSGKKLGSNPDLDAVSKRFRQSGSQDDAAALLMARWAEGDDN